MLNQAPVHSSTLTDGASNLSEDTPNDVPPDISSTGAGARADRSNMHLRQKHLLIEFTIPSYSTIVIWRVGGWWIAGKGFHPLMIYKWETNRYYGFLPNRVVFSFHVNVIVICVLTYINNKKNIFSSYDK